MIGAAIKAALGKVAPWLFAAASVAIAALVPLYCSERSARRSVEKELAVERLAKEALRARIRIEEATLVEAGKVDQDAADKLEAIRVEGEERAERIREELERVEEVEDVDELADLWRDTFGPPKGD